MRAIKFRAWDKIDKKMYDNVGLSLIGVQVYEDPDHQPPENIILDKGRDCFELLQFTGLYDKKGREIYVGDVVCTWSDGSGGVDSWDKEDYGYAEVVMGLPESGVLFIQREDNFSWDWDAEHSIYSLKYCEVIGNVWENPDLITP